MKQTILNIIVWICGESNHPLRPGISRIEKYKTFDHVKFVALLEHLGWTRVDFPFDGFIEYKWNDESIIINAENEALINPNLQNISKLARCSGRNYKSLVEICTKTTTIAISSYE